MNQALALRLVGGGCLLLVAAWVVPHFVSGEQAWDDQMAARLQAASQDYHDALHAHGGTASGLSKLETARNEYLNQRAGLESALERGQDTSKWIRWLGILVTLAGVAIYLVEKITGGK